MGMSGKELAVRLLLLPFLINFMQGLAFAKSVILFIIKMTVMQPKHQVVRTPDERFEGLESLGYKFSPNYVELPIGGGKKLPRVHYVDEGPKDAREMILCLHGEPSWSFLYRKLVPVLVAAGYRVIVPDFIGFGKSDKYTNPMDYNHALHTMTIRLLLDHLKATNVTLVCQDWGGLTGLTVVKDSPHFFSRLVIMNTGLPVGETFTPLRAHLITPFLAWRAFATLFETYLPIGAIFKYALHEAATPDVLAAYCAPFPGELYKGGAARWPLMVPLSKTSEVSPEMVQAREFLKTQWTRPALIMFSDDDPVTGMELGSFQKMLPHAKQVTIHGGGHFLQEAKGVELAENVVKFINQSN